MITGKFRILLSILIGAILSGCGLSQAEAEATATQMAAEIFATQTAQAPTATPTLTPSPTPTVSPTHTPSPSPTADITVRERQLVEEVNALMEAEDSQGAIKLCTQAVSADPAFAMGFAVRGLIMLGLQNLEAAVSDFDKAIELGIVDDLEKEIDSGMAVKTIYYFRGSANMALGAYERGIEDLERFLDLTEPLEYPEFREDAQYRLADWQLESEPAHVGQRFDLPLYSILAPQGEGWGVQMLGPQTVKFGRRDELDDLESVYSERTTVALSGADSLQKGYSDEDFLQFACSYMISREGRYRALDQSCDWWLEFPYDCVRLDGLFEDYGGSDIPYSPPLILDGHSLACRHPDFIDVMIFLHYSQRGLQNSLDDNIEQQAEAFFHGLSFNQLED